METPSTASIIKQLESVKEDLVASQDFPHASQVRDIIDELKKSVPVAPVKELRAERRGQ